MAEEPYIVKEDKYKCQCDITYIFMLSKGLILSILVFFRKIQRWHCWHFFTTSNVNKLEIVANQVHSDTNLNLSRVH